MKNKKIILFIISISLILSSCVNKAIEDEKIACIQVIDRNGLSETISSEEKLKEFEKIDFSTPQSYKNVLRIYKKQENGSIFSKLSSYHENGQLHKYLEVKNARSFGKYKEFYENGNLKIEANIIGGAADFNYQNTWIFDGTCKAFDEAGNLVSEFNYEKGSLEGKSLFYYPNQKIKKIVPYKSNEINGEVLEYDENSFCSVKSNYKNGQKHGQTVSFWSKGNMQFIEEYEEDILINAQYFEKSRARISKIKNKDGQKATFKNEKLYQLIEFKNGKMDGKITTFSENKQILSEYFQKNSIKDGVEIDYFKPNEVVSYSKSLIPKLEISWENGKIHGTIKTWYKNKSLESQKEYSQNKKNGFHYAWYENGTVMFIEQYENDQLLTGTYYQINDKKPVSTITSGSGTATLYDSQGRFLKKISYISKNPCI